MPTRTGPMAQAKEVKIELAEPLAGGKKKGPCRQAPGEARQEGRGTARTGRRQVTVTACTAQRLQPNGMLGSPCA